MPDIDVLTSEQRQFIERVGLYFEQYHLSRIGGRLLGLLMLVEGPLSLDEMATALGVSRASVSTNIRQTADCGLTEHLSLPGDRRDYYRFAENPWQHGLEARIEATRVLRSIAERGLAAVTPTDTAARAHLEELLAFCDFAIEDQREMIARWQERRRRMTDST